MVQTVVITDTSLLINFLALSRIDCFAALADHRFVITEHVRAEITQHFPEQLAALEQALTSGYLTEVTVTDVGELATFAQLSATGLGRGESSAIAVAVYRKWTLAIDDKTATRKALAHDPALTVLNTEQLVVLLIQRGILQIADADQMKLQWETNHRFKLKIASFAEHFPP